MQKSTKLVGVIVPWVDIHIYLGLSEHYGEGL
jgi:hypothetical protein